MKQHRYKGFLGLFRYRQYLRTQIAGNKRKLHHQFIDEGSVRWISERLLERIDTPQFGLCHGTRQGNEQAWFAKFLGCRVIGTEISDSASQFPDTIQWDFHEVKDEWLSACDFVYSNSWDHAYDPTELFTAWMSCVRPRGYLILTHTSAHTIVNELDPLGLELDELCSLLRELGGKDWDVTVPEGAPLVLTTFKGKTFPAAHIFAQRLP